MALTGQLSDMSLAELIEFFCNQRKTGRLKVDYHHGHGVFFVKGGELVDARVGSLSGAEAVYFALTLPNAAFDFSADFEPPRRTIEQSWKQVVLEGLRRLDEGASPRQSDAFGPDWTPTESDLAALMDRIERLDAGDIEGVLQEAPKAEAKAGGDGPAASASKEEREPAAPLSMMVESAGATGGGRKKLYVFAALACVVLACAVAAVPVARRMKAAGQTTAPAAASQPAATQTSNTADASNVPSDAPAEAAPAEAQPEEVTPQVADPAAALTARREREARERLQRERERRAEEARKNEQADKSSEASAEASKPAAPVVSGPKVVRVSVSYDENGRVTQASVAGATPGAEAYGATAVRVARSRRFPAGKPGGTVISIPVN